MQRNRAARQVPSLKQHNPAGQFEHFYLQQALEITWAARPHDDNAVSFFPLYKEARSWVLDQSPKILRWIRPRGCWAPGHVPPVRLQLHDHQIYRCCVNRALLDDRLPKNPVLTSKKRLAQWRNRLESRQKLHLYFQELLHGLPIVNLENYRCCSAATSHFL